MRRRDRSFRLALLGLLALAAPAAGQTIWSGPGTDWNTASNWSPGVVPNSPTADVLFGAPGVGTVNISASVQAGSLGFINPTGTYTLTSSPGQTLTVTAITVGALVTTGQRIDLAAVDGGSLRFPAGGPLTITNNAPDAAGTTLDLFPKTSISTSGAGGVVVTGTGNTDVAGAITASGGLAKSGSGLLALTGDNSHLTGPGNVGVTVTGGTLFFNSDAALGRSDQTLRLDVNSATVGGLQFASFSFPNANLVLTRPVALASTTRFISGANQNDSVNGRITGAGQLVKDGPGNLALSNPANAYTGGTLVVEGELAMGAAGALPAGRPVTVTNSLINLNGFNQSVGALTFGRSPTENPEVLDVAGGTLTLGGDVTVAGGAGTRAATVKCPLDLGGKVRTVTVQNATGQAYDLVINAPVVGSGGLAVTGTASGGGAVAVSVAGTYTGPTTVNSGTLVVAATDALPTGTALTVADGATFTLAPPTTDPHGRVTAGSYDQTVGSLAGAGVVTLGNATLTVGGDGTGTTFLGSIMGAGSVVKVGSGTLTLGNTDYYLGGTTINGGALSVSADYNLGNPNGGVTFGSGRLIATASFTAARPTTLNAAGGTLDVAAGTTLTWNGPVSGAGGLTKDGAGVLVLGNVANTFAGGTLLNAGRLDVPADAALGTGPVIGAAAATVRYTASTTTTRAFTLNSGTLEAPAGVTLTLAGATVSGGFLDGAGTFTLAGGARLSSAVTTAAATLTQTGPATLTNFNHAGALTTTAGQTLTWNGGTVGASGRVTVNGTLNVSNFTNDGQITISPGATLANTGTSGLTLGAGSQTLVGSAASPGGTLNPGSQPLAVAGLLVNNGTVAGPAGVIAGGVTQGAGTFGTFNLGGGGRLAPGNGVGAVTTGATTWQPGGIYQWEISDAAGAAGTTGWDLWQVNGALAVSFIGGGGRPTLELNSLTAANVPGLPAHFDPDRAYQWTILTATGGITGFNANRFTVDSAGFPAPGTFALAQAGGTLVLSYTPVPEPTGLLALCGAAAGAAGWLRFWRRRPVGA